MKQRITVIFMCICLIITMLPTTVSAQTYTEGQLYWIWNSEGVKWNADESRITDGTRSLLGIPMKAISHTMMVKDMCLWRLKQ